MAGQAALMQQISKPVQFALVPFSASVNVGPDKADRGAGWTLDGISPIHHENFDWTTFTVGNQESRQAADGSYFKKGTGWGAEENQCHTLHTLRGTSSGKPDTAVTATTAALCGLGRAASRRGHPPTITMTPRRPPPHPRRCSCRCSRPMNRATSWAVTGNDQRQLERTQQLVERPDRGQFGIVLGPHAQKYMAEIFHSGAFELCGADRRRWPERGVHDQADHAAHRRERDGGQRRHQGGDRRDGADRQYQRA